MTHTHLQNLALTLLLVLASVTAFADDSQPADTSPPNDRVDAQLVGNWLCEDGPCLDEEIQFALVEGQQVYNSWLRARPSASGGTWSIEGDRLTITCCGGLEISQVVVAVDGSSLRLREPESREVAVYSRVEVAGGE